MPEPIVLFFIFSASSFGLLILVYYHIVRNSSTSFMLNALMTYFSSRNEKVIELRTTKEKCLTKPASSKLKQYVKNTILSL
jgi:hypothetical protein